MKKRKSTSAMGHRMVEDSLFTVDVRPGVRIDLPTRRHIVLCPAVDDAAAQKALRLMQARAGSDDCAFVALNDHDRQGFIKTINMAFRQVDAQFVSYVAQDAFAGANWLQRMNAIFENEHVNFAAYNCGKWDGRIAAFGCIRSSWSFGLYGGDLFFPGYISHRADNELTVVARAQRCFAYDPSCLMVEVDYEKPFRKREELAKNFHEVDRELFEDRFASCFDGLISVQSMGALRPEYIKRRKFLHRARSMIGLNKD